MERLTEKHYGGNGYYMACSEHCNKECFDCKEIDKIIDRLGTYEDTGLEPEEIYEVRFLIAAQRDPQKLARLRELVLADRDGRLVELPFVAMVEQSLQDGKMKPMGDQKHNGRYAVVYVDHNKWKSPLIDICGKPYLREEAEARMAALAQEGGSNEQAGDH